MLKPVGEVACPNAPKPPFGLPNVAAPPKEGVPNAGGPPKPPTGAGAPAVAGAANPVCRIDDPPCINDPLPVLGAAPKPVAPPKIEDVPNPVDPPPNTPPPPNALGAKVELLPPKMDEVAGAEVAAVLPKAETPPNIEVPTAGAAAGADCLNAFAVEAAAWAKIPPPNGDDDVAAADTPPNGDDDVAAADTPPNGDDELVTTPPNGLFWAAGATAEIFPPKIDVPPPPPNGPTGDENMLEDVAVPPKTEADDAIDVAVDVVGTEGTPPKMLVPAVVGTANEPNREADGTVAEGCVPNELLPPNGDAFGGAVAAAPLKMDVEESGVLVRTNEEPPNILAPLAGGVAVAVAAVVEGLHTLRP